MLWLAGHSFGTAGIRIPVPNELVEINARG
jgi:hypothetical protein